MRVCSKTIMDETDPDIEFDKDGISNHWHNYFRRLKPLHQDSNIRDKALDKLVLEIKKNKKNKSYDSIVGLSGGVDSTYVCYLAKTLGLNPLVVHFDNGWNSELAVKNIETTINTLELDLYTYVVDYNEFKDLQLSFLKASTPDAEVPTDHGMIALLYKMANKYNIKHILTGVNVTQESILPLKWGYGYFDLKYIKSVHKTFSQTKLKTFPRLPFLKLLYYSKFKGIKFISFLDYFDYNKEKTLKLLTEKVNYKRYQGKHHESVYTRFFQSYILPKKFNIDKRKAHLTNLICSGQITREEALLELEKDIISSEMLKKDKKFLINKFEITKEEFNNIMNLEPKLFLDYSNNYDFFEFLKKLKRIFSAVLGEKIFEIE